MLPEFLYCFSYIKESSNMKLWLWSKSKWGLIIPRDIYFVQKPKSVHQFDVTSSLHPSGECLTYICVISTKILDNGCKLKILTCFMVSFWKREKLLTTNIKFDQVLLVVFFACFHIAFNLRYLSSCHGSSGESTVLAQFWMQKHLVSERTTCITDYIWC